MLHGREGGHGRRCLDPVARYGPQGRYVEVGDVVTVSAEGLLEWRYAGCGEDLIVGNPLLEPSPLRLPPSPDSPTGLRAHQLPAEELAETGRASLVLTTPARCPYWSEPSPAVCLDGSLPDWSLEAVVTLRVTPDSPPSRTLIGEP